MSETAYSAAVKERRRAGRTLAEIGQEYGVSRQAIHAVIRWHEQEHWRRPFVKNIPYQGLYEYAVEFGAEGLDAMAEAIYGDADDTRGAKLRRLLLGERKTIELDAIHKMIEITGKSFEELFAERSA